MTRTTIFFFTVAIGLMNPIGAFNVKLAQTQRCREPCDLRNGHDVDNTSVDAPSRRAIISIGLSFLLFCQRDNEEGRALAFANKISTKYDDIPKRRGPQVSRPTS
jgi:hypothetical protein